MFTISPPPRNAQVRGIALDWKFWDYPKPVPLSKNINLINGLTIISDTLSDILSNILAATPPPARPSFVSSIARPTTIHPSKIFDSVSARTSDRILDRELDKELVKRSI